MEECECSLVFCGTLSKAQGKPCKLCIVVVCQVNTCACQTKNENDLTFCQTCVIIVLCGLIFQESDHHE